MIDVPDLKLPPEPPPEQPEEKTPIKDLAYSKLGGLSLFTQPNLYRLERGRQFTRAGTLVPIASQFKALSLNTSVPQNAVTKGQLDFSQPGFVQKGSIVPTFITVAFTFNAGSPTTLTISWPATAIRRANKQPALNISSDTAIPAGSISITGLSANTTYWYYPYWSEAAQVVGWAGAGNGTSAGSPAIAQTAQSDTVLQAASYQGFVPLNTLQFQQPNAGSSTATGGYNSGNLGITGGGRSYKIF